MFGQNPYMMGGYPGMYAQQMPQATPDQLGQLRAQQAQQHTQQGANGAPMWVQGEAGARSFLVAPGASVMLLDSDAPVFYIKSADAGGRPTLRIFDYTERMAQPMPAQSVQQTPQFVTRDEFEQRLAQFAAERSTGNRQMRRQAKEDESNAEPAV